LDNKLTKYIKIQNKIFNPLNTLLNTNLNINWYLMPIFVQNYTFD